MNKVDQAMAFRSQGMNCAQSVALAFAAEMNLEPSVIKRATEGFGAGMGNRMQTCGALSGAVIVLSMNVADAADPASKQETYKVCGAACEKFVQHCGSSVCREIMNSGDGTALCSCEECIRYGVQLVEELSK